MIMALITLKDVTKIYPKGSRPALDGINLNIERGDFVFLVGASGSGKTTLLRLLLREEEATEGEIRVAGNDLRRLRNRQIPGYRRSIGFVFQDYKLLTNKTVWQNVAFTLEVIGARHSTIKTLVPQVLKTVGLTGKENNYPHELSGGEAQRVALARAYVNHPQILLADEPTGNLDPTTSLGIMEVLDAISHTGTTIVMATHNEEIVNSMRKRVVELHTGKIVRDEAHGSYDSSRYFPDADVAAKSHRAISNPADGDALDHAAQAGVDTGIPAVDQSRFRPQADAASPASAGKDKAETVAPGGGSNQVIQAVEAVSQAVSDSQYGDDGIARLASSVHSGRTGRYGEVFTPVETTLTWGKGIKALSQEETDRNTTAEASDGEDQAGTEPTKGEPAKEEIGGGEPTRTGEQAEKADGNPQPGGPASSHDGAAAGGQAAGRPLPQTSVPGGHTSGGSATGQFASPRSSAGHPQVGQPASQGSASQGSASQGSSRFKSAPVAPGPVPPPPEPPAPPRSGRKGLTGNDTDRGGNGR